MKPRTWKLRYRVGSAVPMDIFTAGGALKIAWALGVRDEDYLIEISGNVSPELRPYEILAELVPVEESER